MVSCVSCGCSHHQKQKDSSITFHSFPKDEKRKTAWIQFVKKPEFIPKSTSVLCSYHFAEDCFDRTSKLKVRLHLNAIPTIEVERLKWVRMYNPIVTKSSKCVENTLKDANMLLSISGPSSIPGSSPMPRLSVREQTPPPPVDMPSMGLEDTPCKAELKRKICELEEINMLKSRKIRMLQKTNWRTKKQLSSLQSLARELKNFNLLSDEHEDTMIQHYGKNEEISGSLLKKSQKKRFPLKNPEKLEVWIQAVRRKNFDPSASSVLCSEHFKEHDYSKSSFRKSLLKPNAVPSIFKFPEHLMKHEPKRRRSLCCEETNVEPSKEVENSIDNEVLRKGAIPSVFEFPKHLLEKENGGILVENSIEIVQIAEEDSVEVKVEHQDDVSSTSQESRIPSLQTCQDSNQDVPLCIVKEEPITSKSGKKIWRKRSVPIYVGDFIESDLECPLKRQRYWDISQATIEELRKSKKQTINKLKICQKKVESLKSLLDDLRRKYPVSSETSIMCGE